MHKSTMSFLFVSLLMLLLPFSSSINILLNAMAFNIVPSMNNDYDEEQNYMERYNKLYQDDSFKENYYNYHKQHHHNQQQEQQQQPMSLNEYDNPYKNDPIDMVNDYAEKYNNIPSYGNNNNNAPRNADAEIGDLTAMEKITKLKQQWMGLTQ